MSDDTLAEVEQLIAETQAFVAECKENNMSKENQINVTLPPALYWAVVKEAKRRTNLVDSAVSLASVVRSILREHLIKDLVNDDS